jgi:hypothetical protein
VPGKMTSISPWLTLTISLSSDLSKTARLDFWRRYSRDKGRRLRSAPFLLYPSDMSDPSELYVEVRGEEIIVVVPHSTYSATYCRSRDSSCLILTLVSSPDKDDPRSTQTAAQFLGLAWQAANDKARELGWIV